MKIENLQEIISDYKQTDRDLINRAYKTAYDAHIDQKRASGKPYITHCVAVAEILAKLRVPPNVVAAGLLHDTVEDTDITLEDIEQNFGSEIARLVDGVTKLTHLPRVSRGDQNIEHVIQETEQENRLKEQAARRGLPDPETETLIRERSRRSDLAQETLRKTFLAMGEDIRVILIKLADRLHNMRTLYHLSPQKQYRIASETLDIFAPLASRLGIWQIKWELEDLGLRYTEPDVYKDIAKKLDERRSEREAKMEQIVKRLENLLAQNKIKAEITGRPKHIYSIYKKMREKDLSFYAIRDVRAVRVIVDSIPTCYSVLGLIHTKWRPLPGEFDDYIAAPKDNFYQSLHTAVLYDDAKTLEIQIRTTEMHENAEYGIAAHWRYKEGSNRDENYENQLVWLRQFMEWIQEEVDDASIFIDSMKTDVFSDRVYVFTPNGDIIDLPAGSTPIDFAYHVHTEVGHRCRGAKVNEKLVSLDYVLKTGDQVEILTAKRGGPSRDWLNPNLKLVNTNRARSKIKYWFRKQDSTQNVSSGKNLFDRELRRLGISSNDISVSRLARDFNYNSPEDLYGSIGVGDLNISKIINYLTLPEKQDEEEEFLEHLRKTKTVEKVTFGDDSVSVQGLKGLLTTLAKCCKPAPGDEIVGYITRGRGATIHRSDCPNILRAKDRERLARVSWGEPKTTYPVDIRINAYDRDGLLRDVSTVIAEEGINMKQVQIGFNKNQVTFDLTLEVGNINQLSRVLTVLENLPNVMEARRIKPG